MAHGTLAPEPGVPSGLATATTLLITTSYVVEGRSCDLTSWAAGDRHRYLV